MHQIHLSDEAYEWIRFQAELFGITVEELIERTYGTRRTVPSGSISRCLGTGLGKGVFKSKEEISAYIGDLRDEWD